MFLFALAFSWKLQSSLPRCPSGVHICFSTIGFTSDSSLSHPSRPSLFIHIFYFSPWRDGYMCKVRGVNGGRGFQILSQASPRPPLAPEPECREPSPTQPSPPRVSGPPEQGQHQSAQASGERIGPSGTNQRARPCTGEGGPRGQSGPS